MGKSPNIYQTCVYGSSYVHTVVRLKKRRRCRSNWTLLFSLGSVSLLEGGFPCSLTLPGLSSPPDQQPQVRVTPPRGGLPSSVTPSSRDCTPSPVVTVTFKSMCPIPSFPLRIPYSNLYSWLKELPLFPKHLSFFFLSLFWSYMAY